MAVAQILDPGSRGPKPQLCHLFSLPAVGARDSHSNTQSSLTSTSQGWWCLCRVIAKTKCAMSFKSVSLWHSSSKNSLVPSQNSKPSPYDGQQGPNDLSGLPAPTISSLAPWEHSSLLPPLQEHWRLCCSSNTPGRFGPRTFATCGALRLEHSTPGSPQLLPSLPPGPYSNVHFIGRPLLLTFIKLTALPPRADSPSCFIFLPNDYHHLTYF